MKWIAPVALLALSPLAATAGAQTLGDARDVAPGHRLYSPRPGTDTNLVDRNGTIVHTWTSNYVVGVSVYMKENGNLLRSILTNSTSPIAVLNGEGGGVEELAFDGTQLWEFRYDSDTYLSHHDIVPMPNGNVLMMAWETRTPAEALAAGRDPALISGDSYPDHIIEVQKTGPTSGTIVWEWYAWDHMIQDVDATQGNYGVVGDHPELIDINFPPGLAGGELHHFNGMDYDPVNDVIIVSARTQDEVWVIDHSTTTAEAAGHTGGRLGRGGDLVYRWGNPQAYDRGTGADQKLFGQHDPRFIPKGRPGAGNVTIFNNNGPASQSEVIEIVLPLDASGQFVLAPGAAYGPDEPTWTYTDPGFFSRLMSSAERLPNGHTLICSSLQGRIFEITTSGRILWEHNVPPAIPAATFHVHYTERSVWASTDTVSAATGGTVRFDLVAGSEFHGQSYLMLGSFSGTNPGFVVQGHRVPLNNDPYLQYLLGFAPFTYHTGHYGRLLDPRGRASSTFTLTPGIAAGFSGFTFDHAYVLFKAITEQVTGVSNAEPFVIVP